MSKVNEHMGKPCKFLKLLGYDMDNLDMCFRCDQMGVKKASSYGMFMTCYYCDCYEEKGSADVNK